MDLEEENRELLKELQESEILKLENEMMKRELEELLKIASQPKVSKPVLSPVDKKLYRINTIAGENRNILTLILLSMVVVFAAVLFYVF